jgi:NADH-quinone oxidoreductase subunit G
MRSGSAIKAAFTWDTITLAKANEDLSALSADRCILSAPGAQEWRAVLVVACDLEEEAPIWWLRVKQAADRGVAIVANPRPTKLERYASHVIRYAYGEEAASVLALVNALSAKRPDLPGKLSLTPEVKAAAQVFAEADNAIVIYGSEGLGLDGSAALAQACANLLISTNHVGRPNNGMLAVWQRANDQGAWELGWRPSPALTDSLKAAKALLVAGANPAGDSPALQSALVEAAQSGAFVVVQELFLTETARLADVVFPVQAYTEREGTLTSGERRVQRFFPAVPVRPDCKADFQVAGLLGQRLGFDLEAQSAARVMARIVAGGASLAEVGPNPYRVLAQTQEQWPIIGRSDLYYGGATYENSQGLGFQLTPAAQRGAAAALSWPQAPGLPEVGDGLLAVPVTLLYDRGETVLPSRLLHQRIPEAFVVLHPDEAQRLRLSSGGGHFGPAVLEVFGNQYLAEVRVDDALPSGLVLVPRSLGLPVDEPLPVRLRLAEKITA